MHDGRKGSGKLLVRGAMKRAKQSRQIEYAFSYFWCCKSRSANFPSVDERRSMRPGAGTEAKRHSAINKNVLWIERLILFAQQLKCEFPAPLPAALCMQVNQSAGADGPHAAHSHRTQSAAKKITNRGAIYLLPIDLLASLLLVSCTCFRMIRNGLLAGESICLLMPWLGVDGVRTAIRLVSRPLFAVRLSAFASSCENTNFHYRIYVRNLFALFLPPLARSAALGKQQTRIDLRVSNKLRTEWSPVCHHLARLMPGKLFRSINDWDGKRKKAIDWFAHSKH